MKFNLRYPGQYADEESGLFYNYFRSYDARTGRYSQPDPIGIGGGWNRFGYVEGNPIGIADSFGLEKIILHNPNDFPWQTSAARDPDSPDALVVYAHGNEAAIGDGRVAGQPAIPLDPKAAADLIRRSGSWKPSMPITVKACYVAADDRSGALWWKSCKPPFTQRLANELGVPLTGPNGYFEVLPTQSGKGYGFSGLYSWSWGGLHGAARRWVTHVPGK